MEQFIKRAVYDKQFKMSAVKLAQEADKSVLDIVKELYVSTSSLRRWINEYDEYGESAFPGHGNALFNSTYGEYRPRGHIPANQANWLRRSLQF